MKVTVCELPDAAAEYRNAWRALVAHVTEQRSDLVLLAEMPAFPWFADLPQFNPSVWQEASLAHDKMI